MTATILPFEQWPDFLDIQEVADAPVVPYRLAYRLSLTIPDRLLDARVTVECPRCEGAGEFVYLADWDYDGNVYHDTETCKACYGHGTIVRKGRGMFAFTDIETRNTGVAWACDHTISVLVYTDDLTETGWYGAQKPPTEATVIIDE